MNWENRCQKQMEIGIMSWDKPWTQVHRKTVSMLYLHLGIEGRRIICSRNPHLKMELLTTVERRQIMESTFIRQRNITFNRYMSHTTRQSKRESIRHFFAIRKNCQRIAILEIKRILWSEIFSMQIRKIPKLNENYLEKLWNYHKPYIWP